MLFRYLKAGPRVITRKGKKYGYEIIAVLQQQKNKTRKDDQMSRPIITNNTAILVG